MRDAMLNLSRGAWPALPASPIALALASALMVGSLIAVGGPMALLLCISVLVSLLIVLDFRVGVVILMLLLPVSASPSFPHSIAGVTGLNPLNLLFVGTIFAAMLGGRGLPRMVPPSLAWCYLLPMLVGAMLGLGHLGDIPAELIEANPNSFDSSGSYLRDVLLKRSLVVVLALLIGAAVMSVDKLERLISPFLVVIWLMSLLTIGLVVTSGTGLGELAGSQSREFFLPLGTHANDLGRLHMFAYALLLFMLAATEDGRLRFFLIASLGVVAIALMLTFSRGAFIGFAMVNLLFLLSRRNLAGLMLSGILFAVVFIALPEAVFDRLSTGLGGGVNAVSAGRVENIWLPLLDEFWRSPLFGNGLGSIAWSDAMRSGRILLVIHPHNAYLQAVLDLGLVGLVLVLSFFYGIWRQFREQSRNLAISPLSRGFFAGAATGLLSLLVCGMAGGSLLPTAEQTYLWFAIGLLYGQRQLMEK